MDNTATGTLGRQIQLIHEQVREAAPDVQRVAVARYIAADGLLTTFISSNIGGVTLQGHQYPLGECPSLQALANSRTPRLLTDLAHELNPATPHSAYVLSEGYVSSFTVPLVHREELLGFVFFDSRRADTFTPAVTRELILHASVLAMAMANDLMAVSSVVGALQIARDFTALRDFETGAHMDRMARYSRIMARDTAEHFGFDDEVVQHMLMYAPLHDIGKIGVPDHILLKDGPLEPDEWEQMKLHTVKGGRMIASILRDLVGIEVPDTQMLRNIVELHHERLDGSGYPYGLVGDAVPTEARIVAVADMFDALTSERPYKAEWDVDESFDQLHRQVEDGELDSSCVEALVAARDELVDVQHAHQEAAA